MYSTVAYIVEKGVTKYAKRYWCDIDNYVFIQNVSSDVQARVVT